MQSEKTEDSNIHYNIRQLQFTSLYLDFLLLYTGLFASLQLNVLFLPLTNALNETAEYHLE